jgi:hypothetical protein
MAINAGDVPPNEVHHKEIDIDYESDRVRENMYKPLATPQQLKSAIAVASRLAEQVSAQQNRQQQTKDSKTPSR